MTRRPSLSGKLMVWCAALALTACLAPAALPTAEVVSTRLMALTHGPLTIAGECLRVGDYALAWPPEFTVQINGPAVTVYDGLTGQRADWRAGDEVFIGGGETDEQRLTAACGASAPPVWLVGGIQIPPTPAAP